MLVWPSTQAVSSYADRGLSDAAGVPQNKIRVDCQYMGGGFGSKFNPGKWGAISAALAKQTGQPVKLMLERDLELAIAGNRPSAYAKIKVGAAKDGTVTTFDAEVWGTAGMGGRVPNAMPYVFGKIPISGSPANASRLTAAPPRPGARQIIRKIASSPWPPSPTPPRP
jgi:xanthine dehydrogenase YagR molybdenum-binding subunit